VVKEGLAYGEQKLMDGTKLRYKLFQIEKLCRRGYRGQPTYAPFSQAELINMMRKIHDLVIEANPHYDSEATLVEELTKCLQELKKAAHSHDAHELGEVAQKYCELNDDYERLTDEQSENPDPAYEAYWNKRNELAEGMKAAALNGDFNRAGQLAKEYYELEETYWKAAFATEAPDSE
jgi:hypothetical protein